MFIYMFDVTKEIFRCLFNDVLYLVAMKHKTYKKIRWGKFLLLAQKLVTFLR